MKKLLYFAICLIFLSACGSKGKDAVNVDIEKCITDLENGLTLEPDYYYVEDYSIKVDGKDISITAVVTDGTSSSSAMDFADTLLRQINLYASQQDSNIAQGNSDGYGGLYDYYNAVIGISHHSNVNSKDDWIINDAITSSTDLLKEK